jgi:hypothetical protein
MDLFHGTNKNLVLTHTLKRTFDVGDLTARLEAAPFQNHFSNHS